MTKRAVSIIFLLFIGCCLHAQQREMQPWDSHSRMYFPNDTNIIVKWFTSGRAAFMIKSKTPYAYKTNRVGFINAAAKIVIPANYINSTSFYGNYAVVQDTTEKLGVIDTTGKAIIPPVYDGIVFCNGGLFFVRNDQSFGLADSTGKIIIQPGRYTQLSAPRVRNTYYGEGDDVGHSYFIWDQLPLYKAPNYGKYIGLKYKDKWAVINRKGKEIIPPTFNWIGLFAGNAAPIKMGDKYGVTDINGNIIIPPKYDDIVLTDANTVIATDEKKTGVLSLSNQLLIPFQYDQVYPINNTALVVTDKQKYGVINYRNQSIIPTINEAIIKFGTGYIVHYSRDSTAIFNAQGKRETIFSSNTKFVNSVFKLQDERGNESFFVYNSAANKFVYYKEISHYERGDRKLLGFLREEKWGLMDTLGREITRPIYDELIFFDQFNYNTNYVLARQNKNWGVIDNQGKVLINFEYDRYRQSDEFIVLNKDRKAALLSMNAKLLTPAIYDEIILSHERYSYNTNRSKYLIPVKVGDKTGFIDSEGKKITPVKYDGYADFTNGLYPLTLNGKTGAIDVSGKEVISFIYESIRAISADAFIVKKDGLYGILNRDGKIIVPITNQNIMLTDRWFNNGKQVYQITRNGKSGFVDTNGKEITEIAYNNIQYIRPIQITAVKNGKAGVFDMNGNVVIPFQYDLLTVYGQIGSKTGFFYQAVINGKMGVLNPQGKLLVPPLYDYVQNPGQADPIVKKDGRFGVINAEGKPMIPFSYDQIQSNYYVPGKYIVKIGEKTGLIDSTGRVIIPINYQYIEVDAHDIYFVYFKKKYGIFDATGKELAPPIFDSYSSCGKDTYVLKKDKLMGLIDYKGKWIYECKYQFINCADGKVVEIY